MRRNNCAQSVISEAHFLANFLIEIERGKVGGDVDVAMHRAAQRWGLEEGALRSLRYRYRELADVKASLLERLREIYEVIYERQRRMAAMEREIEELVEQQDDLFEEEDVLA